MIDARMAVTDEVSFIVGLEIGVQAAQCVFDALLRDQIITPEILAQAEAAFSNACIYYGDNFDESWSD